MDTLTSFYNKLRSLSVAGDENSAKELIRVEFPKLPERVQGEILTSLYMAELRSQNEDADTIANIQERGLEILDALEILEKEIQKNHIDK
jgi:hypothetical protein